MKQMFRLKPVLRNEYYETGKKIWGSVILSGILRDGLTL